MSQMTARIKLNCHILKCFTIFFLVSSGFTLVSPQIYIEIKISYIINIFISDHLRKR